MARSLKFWAGAGLAAGLASALPVAAAEPAKAAGDYPGATLQYDASFAKALKKQLGGEGGEGGIGLTKAGPVFEVPALTSDQLKQALPGNSIRKDQAVAFYFDPNGTVEGWKKDWSPADPSACPTPKGEDYEITDGKCWTAVKNDIKGPYEIKDGAVCMPAYSGKPADGRVCYYVAFMTKYVMIGDGKKIFGSGKDFLPGKHLESELHK